MPLSPLNDAELQRIGAAVDASARALAISPYGRAAAVVSGGSNHVVDHLTATVVDARAKRSTLDHWRDEAVRRATLMDYFGDRLFAAAVHHIDNADGQGSESTFDPTLDLYTALLGAETPVNPGRTYGIVELALSAGDSAVTNGVHPDDALRQCESVLAESLRRLSGVDDVAALPLLHRYAIDRFLAAAFVTNQTPAEVHTLALIAKERPPSATSLLRGVSHLTPPTEIRACLEPLRQCVAELIAERHRRVTGASTTADDVYSYIPFDPTDENDVAMLRALAEPMVGSLQPDEGLGASSQLAHRLVRVDTLHLVATTLIRKRPWANWNFALSTPAVADGRVALHVSKNGKPFASLEVSPFLNDGVARLCMATAPAVVRNLAWGSFETGVDEIHDMAARVLALANRQLGRAFFLDAVRQLTPRTMDDAYALAVSYPTDRSSPANDVGPSLDSLDIQGPLDRRA